MITEEEIEMIEYFMQEHELREECERHVKAFDTIFTYGKECDITQEDKVLLEAFLDSIDLIYFDRYDCIQEDIHDLIDDAIGFSITELVSEGNDLIYDPECIRIRKDIRVLKVCPEGVAINVLVNAMVSYDNTFHVKSKLNCNDYNASEDYDDYNDIQEQDHCIYICELENEGLNLYNQLKPYNNVEFGSLFVLGNVIIIRFVVSNTQEDAGVTA